MGKFKKSFNREERPDRYRNKDRNFKGSFGKKRGLDGEEDRSSHRSFGRGRDSFSGRSGGFDRKMHSATCASCGEKCEVPFKPTGDKPVYCRECFGKDGKMAVSAPAAGTDDLKREIAKLNEKLDYIIELLENPEEEDSE